MASRRALTSASGSRAGSSTNRIATVDQHRIAHLSGSGDQHVVRRPGAPPGTTGTSAATAFLAASCRPSAPLIARAGGPGTPPGRVHAAAESAFSARNGGWIAWGSGARHGIEHLPISVAFACWERAPAAPASASKAWRASTSRFAVDRDRPDSYSRRSVPNHPNAISPRLAR